MKEFKQKPLKGLDDLGDKKYSIKQLNRVNNGHITPISKQATFESRSKGGLTNKKTGHISNLGKMYGGKFFPKEGPTHDIKVIGAQAMAKKSSRIVLQFDLDGNLIKEWPSIQECGRSGFPISSISRCCNNTAKSANGFIWKFKEENQ